MGVTIYFDSVYIVKLYLRSKSNPMSSISSRPCYLLCAILMCVVVCVSFNNKRILAQKSLCPLQCKGDTNPNPTTIKDFSTEHLVQYTHMAMKSASLLSLMLLRSSMVQAKGYNAAVSTFSPGSALYITPQLPQSALLNSLPIESELIGQIQA